MRRLAVLSMTLLPWLATAACSDEIPVAQNAGDSVVIVLLDGGSPSRGEPSDASGTNLDGLPGMFAAANAPSIIASGAGGVPSNCIGVGPAKPTVTLADIGSQQWIAGCDHWPSPMSIPWGPGDAGIDLPSNTVGFEIDPTNHLFYALVLVNGGYAPASGSGSVWWASDVYPGALPDGGPQDYLSVTNANLFDGGSYTHERRWGILYRPASDAGIPSLTLLDVDQAFTIALFPSAAVPPASVH